MTQGMLYIHSAPRALTPHIDWAASGVLGVPVRLIWREQPIEHGLVHAETSWRGRETTGAALASALRGWDDLRFEVTQEPSMHADGARWCHTPDLGIFYAAMDRAGNTVLTEDQVRSCIEHSKRDPLSLTERLNLALGAPWDEELEVYRHAGDGVRMRWLHRVG
ncbi:DUF3145 domain-containing protein [Devriesea agamarum]|uniref:DUF3145 domain-containing protein n=1 Tax=Devriesea agamarum TaxID=472569 RepID=UPI00071E532A|nr:DUF3145 domain-containing protein [Devriesea agamarum]